MISYDVYNVFYYVCIFKSITRAANYLHVSQPAITRHIKNLEAYLGTTLFYRTKEGLKLTDEAQSLFSEVEKGIEIFKNIDTKYKNVRNELSGTITILSGYGTTKLLIFPVIVEFNKLYPKIKFKIDHYRSEDAIHRLRNGEADLFLTRKKDTEKYDNLIINKLYTLHNILVVSSEIADKYPNFIKVSDLNKYPIICKNNVISKQFISNDTNKITADFVPTWELSDTWLVELYIKMNMGIGIISRELIENELKNGTIKEIKTDSPLVPIEINQIIRKDSLSNVILMKFLNFMKSYYKDKL